MTALGTACHLIILVCLPESPKWLLINNKKSQAIASFNHIAKYNLSRNRINQNAYFAEEVVVEEQNEWKPELVIENVDGDNSPDRRNKTIPGQKGRLDLKGEDNF